MKRSSVTGGSQTALSPNRDARPPGAKVDMVVFHDTGMADTRAALARLTAPRSKVSAHYLVAEDGALFSLVPEGERAWHAGVSWWRGVDGVNDRSIGVEVANPGEDWGRHPFPEAQMKAVCALGHVLAQRYGVAPCHVVGHSDIAPERKRDPGALFDWQRLAEKGVGWYPPPVPFSPCGFEAAGGLSSAARLLCAIGYRPPDAGLGRAAVERHLRLCLVAFQRRFRRRLVDGVADGQSLALLEAVAAAYGPWRRSLKNAVSRAAAADSSMPP